MSRYRICIVVVLCLFGQTTVAQLDKNYSPAQFHDTIPHDILKNLQGKLVRDKGSVKAEKSKVNTYIHELYEKRCNLVIENFNEDLFIIDKEITPYLQKILHNIYQANPTLLEETTVYAYRSEVPNAMSFGEGTIGFTLGLLGRLKTEDQIAFVLCHELAHYHAGHSDNKASEIARLNYDKNVKKKVKSISKSEYGRFTKYQELIAHLGLSMNQHGREKELEADSLALLLYLNTSYNRNEPVRALALLDSADVSLYEPNINFRKYFNTISYPFKDSWLTYERSDVWHASLEDHDSTATHPDCKKRIAAIERQLSANRQSLQDKDALSAHKNLIRERSHFEILESGYHFNAYGRTLFNALVLAEQYPENAYLHAMIGKCLFQLYVHQQNHELGKVLHLPDPRYDENYDRFLTFIHALRLMELASLAYHYTESRKDDYQSNEEFLYARWLSCDTPVSNEKRDELKALYLSKFPTGRYVSRMH